VPRSAKARVVKAALLAKGMEPDENHHHMLRKKVDGVVTLVTRMSHDDKEIRGDLVVLMARQCAVRSAEFWQLVDCPLSEKDWEKLIKERCADGRNPFIGQ
jgi:hypothetical protein